MGLPERLVDQHSISSALTDFYQQAFAPGTIKNELRKVGIEEEFVLVHRETFERARVDQLWPDLLRAGWQPVYDDVYSDELVAVQKTVREPESHQNRKLTLGTDAGLGVLEYIGPPVGDLHMTRRLRSAALLEVLTAADAQNIAVLGYGVQPLRAPGPDQWARKGRHEAIIKWLEPFVHNITGTAGTETHVQVGRDEACPLYGAIGAVMAGPIQALCAHSPVWKGVIDPENRYAVREHLWDSLPARSRIGLPELPAASIAEHVRQLLRLEYRLAKYNGEYTVFNGTLLEFVQQPDIDHNVLLRALRLQEGSVWWSARPRHDFGTIEVRALCQQPQWMDMAVHACALGLVCNATKTIQLVRRHVWHEWHELRLKTIAVGPYATLRDGSSALALTAQTLQLARAGLLARGLGEEIYLLPIEHALHSFCDGSKGTLPAIRVQQAVIERGLRGLVDETCLKREFLSS
jgi:glutamate--cysteine ligase